MYRKNNGLWRSGAVSVAAGMLLVSAAGAGAQTYNFSNCNATGAAGPDQVACDAEYSGTELDSQVIVAAGIQSWTVPATGTYRITAVGAQGESPEVDFEGGLGARMSGDFELTTGDVLQIAVGQQGLISSDNWDGGGGGGSFVVDSLDAPMVVAGGGGGTRREANQSGCDASVTTFAISGSGSSPSHTCDVKVSGEGLGGEIDSSWGSSGAGFNGDGVADCSGNGGSSWANGMLGGIGDSAGDGGFGGGGSGEGCAGGGGGGGYSGGDGGHVAGGGGSYVDAAAANVTATAGAGSGDGSVIIQLLAEPADAAPVADAAEPPRPVPAMPLVGLGVMVLGLLGIARRRLVRR